jgi:hypothetical protein
MVFEMAEVAYSRVFKFGMFDKILLLARVGLIL